MNFPIAIEIGSDTTAYGVVVPDIEGCFSAGDTLDEAIHNAREAIEFHLEALADDGVEIPQPSTLDTISRLKKFKGWSWAVVDIDLTQYLGVSQKINVTLPDRLIKKIDDRVSSGARYKTRSGFLQEAAIKALQ